MKRYGLAFKIWMAMFALVVLVLGLSSFFQSALIKKIYIDQQVRRIVESGSDFARNADVMDGSLELDRNVNALAGALYASVSVIDKDGTLLTWSGRRGMGGMGMGTGMGNGMGRWGMMGGISSDTGDVLAGETVIRKGGSHFNGVNVILVAIPIERDGSIVGAVFIHAPLAPIEANINAIHGAVVYSFLLGIAASILLAFFISRKVTDPILRINKAARSMAEGNFGVKIPHKSGDELGLLAESINTLSENLEDKIRKIEKIDSARRGFVTNISHELRTPLTIMQGYTEALMDGIAEDEGQREKYLLNIYDETLRLRRLVDDVLDLRKMEKGKISLELKDINVADLIFGVADQFGEDFTGKNVKLEVELAGGDIIARADPDRVKQVIINLVDNAVRHSPTGGVIRLLGEKSGGAVKVSITDQGPGIGDVDRDLIWERFYKADDSRSERKYSGSGLGLAIAKQIIELHGGKIGVDSSPGMGSTFWFTLKAQA
ncbi:MAG: sensor histidine kinase [Bacillota bacterium]